MMSQSWWKMMRPPAMDAIGCGANSPNGATNCTKWLTSAENRCSTLGMRWKYQLSGLGSGWVS